MYVEVGLVMFTGILGTGHHYYWIGTPSYWLWIGGIFSSLEPIPLLVMVWDAFRTTRETRNVTNKAGLYYTVAHAIFNFVGAGLMGVIHTLPQVNKWTHGTQITTAHGHLAFYGAYVLLVLAMIYVTLPAIRGVKEFNPSRAFQSFWWMTISMVFIVLTIAGANMVQTYHGKAHRSGLCGCQEYIQPLVLDFKGDIRYRLSHRCGDICSGLLQDWQRNGSGKGIT